MENKLIEQIWNKGYKLLFPIIRKREIGDTLIAFIVLRMFEQELADVRDNVIDVFLQNKSKIPESELENLLLATAKQKFYNISDYTLNDFLDQSIDSTLFNEYIKGYNRVALEVFKKGSLISVVDRLVKKNLISKCVSLVFEYNLSDLKTIIEGIGSFQLKKNERKSILRRTMDNGSFCFILRDEIEKTDVNLENYLCVWDFKEGFARFITKQGLWGYLSEDINNELILSSDFYNVEDFSCGRALVQKENKLCGYIDYFGDLIIPAKYRNVTNFNSFKAMVNDAWNKSPFGIDINGNILPEYIEQYEIERKEWESILYEFMDGMNKKAEEKRKQKELYSDFTDDEDNIMRALGNGCGDIYGY